MAQRRIHFDDFSEGESGSKGAELRAFLARAMIEHAPWPCGEWNSEECESVWHAIEFHGCALAIVDRQENLFDWPEALRERMLEEARMQALWEASHRQVLVRLLDAMEAGCVDVLVIKGTALAYDLFPDPAQRRRGDTDLLVRKEQLGEARKILSECGLTLSRTEALQEIWQADTPSGFVHAIDLHWHSASTPALEAIYSPHEAFENAISLPRLSPTARCTDRARTFLSDALNQALHQQSGYLVEGKNRRGMARLTWSYGVKLQAEAFAQSDWDLLVKLATESGSAETCLRALRQSIADFAVKIPHSVLVRLEAAGSGGAIDRVLFHADGWEHLQASWRGAPDWRTRLQLLRNALLSNEDYLRRKYPESEGWPLSLLRVRRLAGATLRKLRRA